MPDDLIVQVVAQPVTTIDEAIATFERIDQLLGPDDGLKWFNLLYMMVVREVVAQPPLEGWSDPEWLKQLDINFTNLYFDALRNAIGNSGNTPKAWKVLFGARNDSRIMRVQFALCGMNAHINRDLQFALVRTFEEMGISPERGSAQHRDFERVNDILEVVEPRALDALATGIVDLIDDGLGRLDDIFAMWSVRRARETAWFNGEVLWNIRRSSFLSSRHNDIVDNFASFAGRGLIVRL